MSWFKKIVTPTPPPVKEKSYSELFDEDLRKFPLETPTGPITAKEAIIIRDYLKYLARIAWSDTHAGYVTGMGRYLITRLEMNMHTFSPNDFVYRESPKKEESADDIG